MIWHLIVMSFCQRWSECTVIKSFDHFEEISCFQFLFVLWHDISACAICLTEIPYRDLLNSTYMTDRKGSGQKTTNYPSVLGSLRWTFIEAQCVDFKIKHIFCVSVQKLEYNLMCTLQNGKSSWDLLFLWLSSPHSHLIFRKAIQPMLPCLLMRMNRYPLCFRGFNCLLGIGGLFKLCCRGSRQKETLEECLPAWF